MTSVICTISFKSGSASLSSMAKREVSEVFAKLTDQPTIILDAYADLAGSEGLNLALTTQRAIAVQEFIMSLGYPPHKLLPRARGERILERADLPKQAPLSRRVELVALT